MNLNQTIYEALLISQHSLIPTLFLGNAGIGKTVTTNHFVADNGYTLTKLVGSHYSAEDILGYPVNNNGVLTKLLPHWFRGILERPEDTHLLFIDELTTVNVYTQAALLTIIFDREIEGHKLPDSCLIVCAGNYSANLGPGFDLLYPLVSRFAVVNLEVNDADIPVYLAKYAPVKPFVQPKYVHEPIVRELKWAIEQSMSTTTQKLVQQKFIDLTEKKFSGIYKDGKCFGVISFRTLNYAREVIIAAYELYGNFENSSMLQMLEGLLAFGTGTHKETKVNIVMAYLEDIRIAVRKFESLKDAHSSNVTVATNLAVSDNLDNLTKPDLRMDQFTNSVSRIISFRADSQYVSEFLKQVNGFSSELRTLDIDQFDIYASGILKVVNLAHSNLEMSGDSNVRVYSEMVKKTLKSQIPSRDESKFFDEVIKL